MLIKMTRADDGHTVDVHPSMVDDYKLGGYRVDDTHPLDHDGDGKPGGSLPDSVPPRRRGRKPKAE